MKKLFLVLSIALTLLSAYAADDKLTLQGRVKEEITKSTSLRPVYSFTILPAMSATPCRPTKA